MFFFAIKNYNYYVDTTRRTSTPFLPAYASYSTLSVYMYVCIPDFARSPYMLRFQFLRLDFAIKTHFGKITL